MAGFYVPNFTAGGSLLRATRMVSWQLVLRKPSLELSYESLERNTEGFRPSPYLNEVEPSLTSFVLADLTLRDPKPPSQVALRSVGPQACFY